jgi:hypothetical protein
VHNRVLSIPSYVQSNARTAGLARAGSFSSGTRSRAAYVGCRSEPTNDEKLALRTWHRLPLWVDCRNSAVSAYETGMCPTAAIGLTGTVYIRQAATSHSTDSCEEAIRLARSLCRARHGATHASANGPDIKTQLGSSCCQVAPSGTRSSRLMISGVRGSRTRRERWTTA